MGRFLSRGFKILDALKRRDSFEIYTDGSLKRGVGAWAFVVVQKGVVIHEASGRVKRTDSNRMEFRAAVEALQWLPCESKVVLYSDSRLLIDTLTQWRHEWKAAGWAKPRQRAIHNLDYIQTLDALSEKHSITWKWVRAHSGIKHNERCDLLCIGTRESQKA